MTTIVTGSETFKSNRPFIFEDTNIECLLLFNYKNAAKHPQRGMVSNNLFAKRTNKVHMTLKPLSNFAPSPNLLTLSPRKATKKDTLEPFHKRADTVGFSMATKPK